MPASRSHSPSLPYVMSRRSILKGRSATKFWRCTRCGDCNFQPNTRCICCGNLRPVASAKADAAAAKAAATKVAAAKRAATKPAAAALGAILRRGDPAAAAIPAAFAPQLTAGDEAAEDHITRVTTWLLANPWELRKCRSLDGMLAATLAVLRHCSPTS